MGSEQSSTNNNSRNQPQPPQPPSFANLHPPTSSANNNHNNNIPKKQEGLGIGRESKSSVLTLEDASDKRGKSKFFTDCKKEYLASINCRLEHFDHKESGACQPLFDHYKECRKEENRLRLEENAAGGGGFF